MSDLDRIFLENVGKMWTVTSTKDFIALIMYGEKIEKTFFDIFGKKLDKCPIGCYN